MGIYFSDVNIRLEGRSPPALDHFRFGTDKKPTWPVGTRNNKICQAVFARPPVNDAAAATVYVVFTPLHYYYYYSYSTPTTLLYYTLIWCMQGTREYRDGINKPEAYTKESPHGPTVPQPPPSPSSSKSVSTSSGHD